MKAYPFMHKHPTSGQTTIEEGMDLRDYFAGLAMQSYIQINAYGDVSNDEIRDKYIAQGAYEIADAMIEIKKQRKEVPHE